MCHCFPDVMLCLALQRESKGGKAYEFFAVPLCKEQLMSVLFIFIATDLAWSRMAVFCLFFM